MLSADLRLPGVGLTSKHAHINQCGNWTIARHHLGWNLVDGGLRHWLHIGRSFVGHLRKTMVSSTMEFLSNQFTKIRQVLHRCISLGSHWNHHWSERPEYQHVNRTYTQKIYPAGLLTCLRPQTPSTGLLQLDNCLSTSVSASSYPTASEDL
jgi:hypothetical protein